MMNLALPMDLLAANSAHHHHLSGGGATGVGGGNTNGIGHHSSGGLPPPSVGGGLHPHPHHAQHHSNHPHHHHMPTRLYNSPPPISSSDPTVNDCKLIEYRGKQLVSFTVGGEKMLCLPQAVDMFLKNYVGGPHTVYCKLKRLDIVPLVCNTEQIRILRGLGVLQPGVNRCKLLCVKDFDTLLDDCENARPGRPPKRGSIGMPLPPSAAAYLASASSSAATAAAASEHPQIKKLRQENGDESLYDDRNHFSDQTSASHPHNHILDGSNKSSPASSAASSSHLLAETANQINHMAFMQMNNFPSLMANRMSTAAAAAAAAAAGMFPSAMTSEQEHLLRRASAATPSSTSSTPTNASTNHHLPHNSHPLLNHRHPLTHNDSVLKEHIINREIDMETFFRSGLWAKNLGGSNNYQSQYEDMVKHLERLKQENDTSQRLSSELKYKESLQGQSMSSPVLNLSKSDNAPAVDISRHAEDSWSRKSRSITPDADDGQESAKSNHIDRHGNDNDNNSHNADDEDENPEDNRHDSVLIKPKLENNNQMRIDNNSRPPSTILSRTPSRNVSPLIEEPTFSMEILLRNIQALLKIAADNAMHFEKQNLYERAELKMDVLREKEIKDSIEKQLQEERKLRVLYQKRYRKEKRLRARLG